jgi:hypothetical protein
MRNNGHVGTDMTVQMCLSVPAGLHLNLLLHYCLEIADLQHASRMDRLLLLHVAVAAVAMLLVPLLQSAPPQKPCISAEQPRGRSEAFDNNGREDSNGQSVHRMLMPIHGQNGEIRGVSEVNADSDALSIKLQKGHGRARSGALRDLSFLLSIWQFWILLIAFATTMSAFSVYHIIMEVWTANSWGEALAHVHKCILLRGCLGNIDIGVCGVPFN